MLAVESQFLESPLGEVPAVVDQERAMEPDAPLLHEEVGSNVVNHRVLGYGDVDSAFAEANVVVRERFKFHKYSSTPIETRVAIAQYDEGTGVMTIWSNFHGPYSLHSFVAKGLNVPENKLRLIGPPDIGGSMRVSSVTDTFPRCLARVESRVVAAEIQRIIS